MHTRRSATEGVLEGDSDLGILDGEEQRELDRDIFIILVVNFQIIIKHGISEFYK